MLVFVLRETRAVIALASTTLLVSAVGCFPDEARVRQGPSWPQRDSVDALTVDCDERISGGVIKEYPWRQQSIITGPVAFWPAKSEFPKVRSAWLQPVSTEGGERRFAADQLKLQIIIERDARAVVAIAPEARNLAAFLFRKDYKTKGYQIRQGTPALDVTGCTDAGPHTEYSTALVVDGPRCLPLLVAVEGAPNAIDTFLPIGVASCPTP